MNTRKHPLDQLAKQVSIYKKKPFLFYKKNGQWKNYSWAEVQEKAQIIAGSLKKIGLKPKSKIAILSENSPEWIIIDLALMIGEYISVPIYPSANTKTVNYILLNSDSKAIFIGKTNDNNAKATLVEQKNIITLGMPNESLKTDYSWYHILNYGIHQKEYSRQNHNEPCTIIYTSGSSGAAKGVVHSAESLSWAAHQASQKTQLSDKDRFFAYLTFAHITERVFIELAGIYSGAQIYFNDHKKNIFENTKYSKPTIFLATPRILQIIKKSLEDIKTVKILMHIAKNNFFKEKISKLIQKKLGFHKIRILGCGTAPIETSILRWFEQINISICEAWGMTENAAYSIINYPVNKDKTGSIGKPDPECDCKIDPNNNELLFKSPALMLEYYNMKEATKSAFDKDGYFKTGDIATKDQDNYFFINGRLNENFKTAKGKFINPIEIEKMIRNKIPMMDNLCVIGTGLRQPVLIGVSQEKNKDKITKEIYSNITNINQELESHERIYLVIIDQQKWTAKNGLITPTLKIKRKEIEDHYKEIMLNHEESKQSIKIIWL